MTMERDSTHPNYAESQLKFVMSQVSQHGCNQQTMSYDKAHIFRVLLSPNELVCNRNNRHKCREEYTQTILLLQCCVDKAEPLK